MYVKVNFFFKLYNIVLVLPYINMNPPQVYTWIRHRYTRVPHPEPSSLLPPRTIPLGHPSAPAPSIQWFLSNLSLFSFFLGQYSFSFDIFTKNNFQSVEFMVFYLLLLFIYTQIFINSFHLLALILLCSFIQCLNMRN